MLYFIEGIKATSKDVLEQHGLDHLVGNQAGGRESGTGPGGKPGCLVVDQSRFKRIQFSPDQQTWEPRFGYPGTWVGMWNDSPPGPEELASEKQLDGPVVRLLDGNLWQIPLLREWSLFEGDVVYECCLPRVFMQCQETGRLKPGDVVRQYRQLWDDSVTVTEAMLGGGRSDNDPEFDSRFLDQFLGSLLAANYQVSLTEISLLQLIDEGLSGEVIRASIGWQSVLDLSAELQCQN